jgi:hypothetical protein
VKLRPGSCLALAIPASAASNVLAETRAISGKDVPPALGPVACGPATAATTSCHSRVLGIGPRRV